MLEINGSKQYLIKKIFLLRILLFNMHEIPSILLFNMHEIPFILLFNMHEIPSILLFNIWIEFNTIPSIIHNIKFIKKY